MPKLAHKKKTSVTSVRLGRGFKKISALTFSLPVTMALSVFVPVAASAENTTEANSRDDDLVIVVRQGDSLSRILLDNLGSYSAIDEVVKYNKLKSWCRFRNCRKTRYRKTRG